MNKVLTTIALSLSALMATSAMAAPQQDSRFNHQSSASTHWNSNDKHSSNQYSNYGNRYNSHKVNPKRDLRVGQSLPHQYDSSRYKVDYRDVKHLKKPKRNEAWYKVRGDYVLVDTKKNTILRIA